MKRICVKCWDPLPKYAHSFCTPCAKLQRRHRGKIQKRHRYRTKKPQYLETNKRYYLKNREQILAYYKAYRKQKRLEYIYGFKETINQEKETNGHLQTTRVH